MANKIQYRRDTAAAWTAANPILSAGEPAVETDTKRRKIGDGTTAWNSLPYQFDRTTGDATYATPAFASIGGARPNTWASIGDSITAAANHATNSQGGLDGNRRSWQAHANIYLNQRLDPVVNYAVSGTRSDEALNSQLPQVLAMNPRPGYCAVMSGTNDINQGYTDTQVIASLTSIISQLLTANIRPIVGTITPRTGFAGAQITYHHKVNAWLRANVAKLGGILVDWNPILANSDGTPATNVLQDGLHPTPYGAALMGKVFYDAVKNAIPEAPKLPGSNAESPNPVLNTNPLMTGTTGTVASGGTGSAATSFKVAGAGGAAYTAALSKVARTDGVPGDWQQAVISGATSVQVYQQITDLTRFAVGDTVYALIEFESDADLSAATLFTGTLLAQGSAPRGSSTLTTIAGDTYTGPVVVPNKGVLRTPNVVIPAGVTELWPLVKVSGGNGTFRVGRVSVLKA